MESQTITVKVLISNITPLSTCRTGHCTVLLLLSQILLIVFHIWNIPTVLTLPLYFLTYMNKVYIYKNVTFIHSLIKFMYI